MNNIKREGSIVEIFKGLQRFGSWHHNYTYRHCIECGLLLDIVFILHCVLRPLAAFLVIEVVIN